MRLTLRTMLCYLDDVLEPADARELGAKIDESEYASNIVHRIRTSMRRLRLSAPAPSGKEMGLDPNTVADYLDNTLEAEQVPDFERVCLDTESEMHLAEVAACHQILTLVLGEPAEVPMSMRQRVYGLGYSGDPAAGATPAAGSGSTSGEITAPPQQQSAVAATTPATAETTSEIPDGPAGEQRRVDAPTPAKKEREKPEIPEYLKQSNGRRTWPIALAILLLGVAVSGVILAFWRPGGTNVAVVDPAEQQPASDGADDLFNVTEPQPRDDGDLPDAPPVIDGTMDDPAGGATTDGGQPLLPAGTDDRQPEPDDGTPPNPDGDDEIARIDPPVGSGEPDVEPDGGSPTPPVLPPVDKVVGHFISTGQVLIAWDEEAGSWSRLAQRTALKPGVKIRSLPTYRPQILLDNDIQITFAGEGIASVGNPVDGVPAVNFDGGQVVIATMGEVGNRLALRVGERDVLLTMADAEAVIAIGAYQFHTPGDDPQTDIPHVRVVALATGGQVHWQQAGTEPVTLDAGQQLSFLDDGLPIVAAVENFPKWVRTNDISEIDRLASATLEPLLGEDRPVEIALEEQSEHPRVEVRSLAARCLASIEKFDRIIDTFNDESLKSYWSQHFDHLQAALARGPLAAARVFDALERRKGGEAERIYRMLRGYSPKQLEEGEDKILVDYLKHDSLDVRVLAISNLRRITGRTQGFHPHLPEARRRTAQRQWDQAASGGTIRYLNPPAELPKREKTP